MPHRKPHTFSIQTRPAKYHPQYHQSGTKSNSILAKPKPLPKINNQAPLPFPQSAIWFLDTLNTQPLLESPGIPHSRKIRETPSTLMSLLLLLLCFTPAVAQSSPTARRSEIATEENAFSMEQYAKDPHSFHYANWQARKDEVHTKLAAICPQEKLKAPPKIKIGQKSLYDQIKPHTKVVMPVIISSAIPDSLRAKINQKVHTIISELIETEDYFKQVFSYSDIRIVLEPSDNRENMGEYVNSPNGAEIRLRISEHTTSFDLKISIKHEVFHAFTELYFLEHHAQFLSSLPAKWVGRFPTETLQSRKIISTFWYLADEILTRFKNSICSGTSVILAIPELLQKEHEHQLSSQEAILLRSYYHAASTYKFGTLKILRISKSGFVPEYVPHLNELLKQEDPLIRPLASANHYDSHIKIVAVTFRSIGNSSTPWILIPEIIGWVLNLDLKYQDAINNMKNRGLDDERLYWGEMHAMLMGFGSTVLKTFYPQLYEDTYELLVHYARAHASNFPTPPPIQPHMRTEL